VDKALEESADAYVSINAELLDELPKFLRLASTYRAAVLGHVATVQARVYEAIRDQLGPVGDMVEEAAASAALGSQARRLRRRKSAGGGGGAVVARRYLGDEIVQDWKEAIEMGEGGSELEERIRDISFLRRWMEDVWLNDDFSDAASLPAARSWSLGSGGGPRKPSSVSLTEPTADASHRLSRSLGTSPSLPRSRLAAARGAASDAGRDPGGRLSVLDVAGIRAASAGNRYASSARGPDTIPHHRHQPPRSSASSVAAESLDAAAAAAAELSLRRSRQPSSSASAISSSSTPPSPTSPSVVIVTADDDEDDGMGGGDGDAIGSEAFWAVSLYPFAREYDDEIDLAPDQAVWVDRCEGRGGEPAPDWWHGHVAGRQGWFPRNYVRRLD
ncbi:hypothetical protein HK405_014115, partial [Cladochytrium tenue]